MKDVRLDRSNIGVVGKLPKRIIFKDSLEKTFEDKLSETVGKNEVSENKKLRIFLKKLRVSVIDSFPKEKRLNSKMIQLSGELEAYYSDAEKWYPAYRIDTTYIMLNEEVEDLSLLIKPFTDAILVKVANMNIEKIKKRNAYLSEEIESRYKHSIPEVFTNGTHRKGAYMSFEEFKNNTPSIENVNFRMDIFNHIYIKSDSVFNSFKIFAYSDGLRLWIFTDMGIFPLIKKDSRYEFFGYVNRQRSSSFGSIDYSAPSSVMSLQLTNMMSKAVVKGKTEDNQAVHFFDIMTGIIY